jgi:hypothetical protein
VLHNLRGSRTLHLGPHAPQSHMVTLKARPVPSRAHKRMYLLWALLHRLHSWGESRGNLLETARSGSPRTTAHHYTTLFITEVAPHHVHAKLGEEDNQAYSSKFPIHSHYYSHSSHFRGSRSRT